MATAFTIPGQAGNLEAHLDEVDDACAVAVLAHPHPQYGGSMHDAVLATAANVLLDHRTTCLRFNFRGVGASSGSYDQGQGEVNDVVAAAAWLREKYPSLPLWLSGYSFGASMVWQALSRTAYERAILIAPPVGIMDFNGSANAVQAIAGDRDDFVDADKFTTWLGADAHLIPGADHFFSGSHAQLASTLKSILAPS